MALDATFVPYRIAAAYLRDRLIEAGITTLPSVGIICGSGLSGLSEALESSSQQLAVAYADIPGFPAHCTVPGHEGQVVFGMLSSQSISSSSSSSVPSNSSSSSSSSSTKVPTIIFRGRFHSYEGHSMKTTVLPVRIMRCLGVQIVILTNAAGGLHPDLHVGDMVVISDHVALPQLAGNNALVGPNDDELGPRFPPTSNAYDPELRHVAVQAAHQLGMTLFCVPRGVYCFVAGVRVFVLYVGWCVCVCVAAL
jgi:purine-nucleoside phosphorylase